MSFKQDFPTPNSGNSMGNHCFSPQWGDVVNHAEDAEAMRELLKDAEHGDQDSVPEDRELDRWEDMVDLDY